MVRLKKIVLIDWIIFIFSFLPGAFIAWLVKDDLTALILSGKSFTNRSSSSQLTIFLLYTVNTSVLIAAFIYLIIKAYKFAGLKLLTSSNGYNRVSIIVLTVIQLLFLAILLKLIGIPALFGPRFALASIPTLAILLTTIFTLTNNSLQSNSPIKRNLSAISNWLNKNATMVFVLTSIILVFGIFGKILLAKWFIVDDHEFFWFMGVDQRASINELLPNLMKTEVGNLGVVARFRPVYYFLRILETIFFGNHPPYYFFLRLSFLIFALAVAGKLIAKFTSIGFALALMAFTLTFPYWGDILTRLGPSEHYVVPGLAIYAWGFCKIETGHNRQNDWRAIIALLTGSILCVGSKENLLLLLLPNLYILFKAFVRRSWFLIFTQLMAFIFSLWVVWKVLFVVSSGVDVYAATITPADRLSRLMESISSPQAGIYSTILLIWAAIILILQKVDTGLKNQSPKLLSIFFSFIVFLGIHISQLVFYNGDWPRNMRYDFPGLLYIPAGIALLHLMAQKLARNKRAISTAWVLALILSVAVNGYRNHIELVGRQVVQTTEFTQGIESLSENLYREPSAPMIIENSSPFDYEYTISYARFLRGYGAVNPIFLRIHGYSAADTWDPLGNQIALALEDISANGDDIFSPLGQLPAGECYSLFVFNQVDTNCQILK